MSPLVTGATHFELLLEILRMPAVWAVNLGELNFTDAQEVRPFEESDKHKNEADHCTWRTSLIPAVVFVGGTVARYHWVSSVVCISGVQLPQGGPEGRVHGRHSAQQVQRKEHTVEILTQCSTECSYPECREDVVGSGQ